MISILKKYYYPLAQRVSALQLLYSKKTAECSKNLGLQQHLVYSLEMYVRIETLSVDFVYDNTSLCSGA